MGKRYFYDHGLPFDKDLAENINGLIDRVKKNKASLIIIDGGVGEGKTTLLVHILDYINKLHGKNQIRLGLKDHPQLALGGGEFLNNLKKCYDEQLPVLGYDEAGDFNRRGSISRFNAMLNRTFETFRGFKIIVVICLPCFNVLDNNLFDNNIPRGLLHLKDRNMGYGNYEGYSLVAMNWIRYWFDKLPKGAKFKAYDKVQTNFRGHFLDLEPERSKQLDILSTTGKIKVLKKATIKLEGLVSYRELATKLNRSHTWVYEALKKLKIKPKRTIDRQRYFDQDVLNLLTDYMEELPKQGQRKR